MDVILIRHGRTEANERRLYCGATDLPLSEAGLASLRQQAAECIYPDAAGLRIYTSGMLRADQTLAEIYGIAPQDTLSGMRELDFGRFEMHSYEELKDDPDYIAWISDDSGNTPCPGGESSMEFRRRVFDSFDSLLAQGYSALVVCHGGVIAELMARLFPDHGKNFYEWQPSAGCGYAIRFDNGRPISYNAVPRLK